MFMAVTERRKQVLEAIAVLQTNYGFPPSLEEICANMGLASKGSLSKHVRALEEEGMLEGTPGKRRSWKITQRGWKLIDMSPTPYIPIIGQIAAGTPILAQQNREGELAVDPSLFGSDEAFALRVRGDSMVDAKISDGDLAIIRPQEDAENGQIVAVVVDGMESDATLKIFRRRKGSIELQPANKNYEPIVFKGRARSRVKIQGALIGVIRLIKA